VSGLLAAWIGERSLVVDVVIRMDRDKVLGAFVGEGRCTEEQDSMS
jgi:hypothetical protein